MYDIGGTHSVAVAAGDAIANDTRAAFVGLKKWCVGKIHLGLFEGETYSGGAANLVTTRTVVSTRLSDGVGDTKGEDSEEKQFSVPKVWLSKHSMNAR